MFAKIGTRGQVVIQIRHGMMVDVRNDRAAGARGVILKAVPFSTKSDMTCTGVRSYTQCCAVRTPAYRGTTPCAQLYTADGPTRTAVLCCPPHPICTAVSATAVGHAYAAVRSDSFTMHGVHMTANNRVE
jgi:hypothetical protein